VAHTAVRLPGPPPGAGSGRTSGPAATALAPPYRKDPIMPEAFVPTPDLAELAAVNTHLKTMAHPDVSTAEGLAALRSTDFTAHRAVTHPVADRIIPGPAGELRLRVIRPAGPLRAVLFDIHGGGWSIGTPEETDGINNHHATALGIATVSVDYRLAPEHPYPAALDDCVAGARWLGEHADAEFGTGTLLIQGASAGGHLAAQTLLRLRDDSPGILARFAAASLVFGVYDLGRTPSQRAATADTLVLPDPWLRAFSTNAFGDLDPESLRDPAISPLYADLTGLPPALFTVGDLDPLLDDSLFMAARWRAAGNHTDLDVWPQCVHGFINMAPKTGAATLDRISSWLGSRLAA
jgi:acetyl esterase